MDAAHPRYLFTSKDFGRPIAAADLETLIEMSTVQTTSLIERSINNGIEWAAYLKDHKIARTGVAFVDSLGQMGTGFIISGEQDAVQLRLVAPYLTVIRL